MVRGTMVNRTYGTLNYLYGYLRFWEQLFVVFTMVPRNNNFETVLGRIHRLRIPAGRFCFESYITVGDWVCFREFFSGEPETLSRITTSKNACSRKTL